MRDDSSLTPSEIQLLLTKGSHSLTLTFREAKVEFGEAIAARLKLSKDGTKVLWPQPTDDPEDPQNVGSRIWRLLSFYLGLTSNMS